MLSGDLSSSMLISDQSDIISQTLDMSEGLSLVSDQDKMIYSGSNMANLIKASYINGSLWSMFKVVGSKPDGHCILNSILLCLSSLHSFEYKIEFLIDNLMQESNDFEKYSHFYSEDRVTYFSERHNYVYNRQYDSLFCELIPSLMTNVLNHIIIVLNEVTDIDCSDVPPNVYDFIPSEYVNETPICKTCGLKLGVIVLLRRSHHYDACVQSLNHTKPCSCKVPYVYSPILSDCV